MSSSIVKIENVSKTYKGSTTASLNHVDFSIQKGEKLGVFGPNGAGKTTLISILTGIIKQTEGLVSYTFHEQASSLDKVIHQIGYVPQDFAFYEELSPVQNLEYFGTLYNIPKDVLKNRIVQLMQNLGLSHVQHNKVSTFSGGMKRRVNLAIGIIHQPSLLFLDEPTVGVDVQSKSAILAFLNQLNEQGTTIVYTSHHLQEAEEFCNRFILMDFGKIIAEDELEHLLEKHNSSSLLDVFLKLTGTQYRD